MSNAFLKAVPLTKQAFAPFGEVIETDGLNPMIINQGFAKRFNTLAYVDVSDEGGLVNISIVTATPRPKPIVIKLMERHPLGSQIFFPLQDEEWLVLVCTDPKIETSYRLFQATGLQGINYRKNAWHHPLLVQGNNRFIVVDRRGPGNNLEEMQLEYFLTL